MGTGRTDYNTVPLVCHGNGEREVKVEIYSCVPMQNSKNTKKGSLLLLIWERKYKGKIWKRKEKKAKKEMESAS